MTFSGSNASIDISANGPRKTKGHIMDTYESIETLGEHAPIATRVNATNYILNLVGAFTRSDIIFPVSGDDLARAKAALK